METQISKLDREEIRRKIFLHLDGWAIIPTICTLKKLHIIELFLSKEKWSLRELNSKVNVNEGYLNVALRILASQNYLIRSVDNRSDEIYLELKTQGKKAFLLIEHYQYFYELQKDFTVRPRNIISENNDITRLVDAWVKLEEFKSIIKDDITNRMAMHMEGILLGPMLVALGINGKLHELDLNSILSATYFEISSEVFNWFISILKKNDFIISSENTIKLMRRDYTT